MHSGSVNTVGGIAFFFRSPTNAVGGCLLFFFLRSGANAVGGMCFFFSFKYNCVSVKLFVK